MPVTITAQSHPAIHKAFCFIECDSYGPDTPLLKEPIIWEVPDGEWPAKLETCEQVLASLTDEELETFCTGEYEDRMEIVGRKYLAEHKAIVDAERLLIHFFNSWEGYD